MNYDSGSVKTSRVFMMVLILSLVYLAVLPAPVAAYPLGNLYVGANKAVFTAFCTEKAGVTHYKIYANSGKYGKVLIETYPADGETREGLTFPEDGVQYKLEMFALYESGVEIFEDRTEFTGGVPSGALEGGDTWDAQVIN